MKIWHLFAIFCLFAVISIIITLAIYCGVGYVGWHFLQKVW